jgi:hypothetical protein
MKTLREIYTHLVATHAANTPGEMVTTFSDKGSMHSYIDYYERHFAPHREHASVLEIGVMTGGSLLLWQEYFDTVWLTGIDLREGFNSELPFQSEIVARFHWGVDSTDSAQVPDLPEYQFVIDDGAHDAASQIATFKNYWQFVAPGGTYFIEDIENDSSLQTITQFLLGWQKFHPHTTDYYRGHAHRQDDRILAITKEIK